MLIKDILRQQTFTESEQIIVDYFLEEKVSLLQRSTRDISKKLYCSPASIIRLCQKLGFTGFDEFKKQYLEELEYINHHVIEVDPNNPFHVDDSIQAISHNISLLYQGIIEDTQSLLTHDQLRNALNILNRNKNIYIVTSSSHVGIANTFKDKMSRIGKHVSVYDNLDEAYYEVGYLKPGDAAFILVSYTGETRNCLIIAKKLKEINLDFISITSYGTNTLSSLSQYTLHVSTREKIRNNLGNYAMPLAILYLFDVLYSGYFSLNYEKNKQNRLQSAIEYETLKYDTITTNKLRDTNNDLIK